MGSSSHSPTLLAFTFTVVAFLFLFPSLIESRRIPPGTPSLCRNSDFPAICTSISRNVQQPLTPTNIAEAAIKVAIGKSMRARATAARLAHSMRDRKLRMYLGVCRSAYSDALDSLRTAAEVLKTTKNKDDIQINLSAVVYTVGSCEDSFGEVPGMKFPLKKVNDNLMKMVRNALAMGDQL